MTLSELVAQCYLKATGKVSSLTSSDSKYQKILQIANIYISVWQNTPGVDWSSLYNKALNTGTVTATDTFALDTTIRKLSDQRGDYVQIEDTDGILHDYQVVPADTLKRYAENAPVCSQIGSNLVFRSAFASDSPLLGGTIYVPCYTFAPTLSIATDEVPVDIPEWLVFMTAAEYVRNDVTKMGQYGNLVGEASAILDRMIEDNDSQVEEVNTPWTPHGRTW